MVSVLSDTELRDETVDVNERSTRSRPQKANGRSMAPTLRPPTLMIDLLFGALMLFAFQMGDPSIRQIVPRDIDLPTADETAGNKAKELLPLKPVRTGTNDWVYELPSGKRLSVDAVVKMVQAEGKTPVLLVASTAKVQNYIDAEQPLRQAGLKAGLAVALKGETPK
tara:strand:- start:182 stop:682 length:501 start_codon:yes stop_codon:yes gene_type:complete